MNVPVTYRKVWLDGFGARGWKLDCSIGEPSVIAATAECGRRVPTSVLVHDLLDHHLCGVGIGGHRNEAIALVQLAERTGTDPRPDIRQIIREDLLQGHVNGEPMRSFLPAELLALVPDSLDGLPLIRALERLLGSEGLQEALLQHFLAIGSQAAEDARRGFEGMGLPYALRREMGLCLQQILVQADGEMQSLGVDEEHGWFSVGEELCGLHLSGCGRDYQAAVNGLASEGG